MAGEQPIMASRRLSLRRFLHGLFLGLKIYECACRGSCALLLGPAQGP